MESQEIENIKKNDMEILEVKHIITKTKSPLERLSGGTRMAEERGSELEDRSIEMTHFVLQRGKRGSKTNEQRLRDLWHDIETSHICVLKLLEKEEGVVKKKIFEGAPGWLSRLSVRLRLRSRSHGP